MMEENRERRSGLRGRLHSFACAFRGLGHAVITQANLRIHMIAVMVVVACGWIAGLSGTEWCILILAMGLVISLELANTAIEKLADRVSPGYDERIGQVKDVAAAAVLVAAIAAVIIGALIFIPKITGL